MTASALHYIFAYGSLICPKSRAVTAPTVAERTATPVVVKNVERTWAKKASMSGMTAMGVRFMDGAECVGVLLPVNDSELGAFDKREKGYDRGKFFFCGYVLLSCLRICLELSHSPLAYRSPTRKITVPLDLDDVEPVPFLDEKVYDEEGHEVFLEAKEKDELEADINIWMYHQQDLQPPSPEAPIAQSYVDTILRGCLSISEDFAEKFIADTKGWTPSEVDDYEENDNISVEEQSSSSDSSVNSNSSDNEVYWVNDRHDPIYTRGDQEFMLEYGPELDQLLKQHREEEFQHRSRRVRLSAE